MTIEEVFKSLDGNSNISSFGKDEIKEILGAIIKRYPNINLESLNSKISSLELVEEGKFTFDGVIDYNHNFNKISFNKEKIEEYDQKNILANALIKMCFSNEREIDDRYQALFEGTAAQMTNMIVGSENDKVYNQDELYETNLISAIIGADKIEKAFVTRDYSEIAMQRGIPFICDKMSYSYNYKMNKSDSNFAEVEQNLIQLLFSEKRDNSQIAFFEMNLVTNENYMNNPSDYIGISELEKYYYNQKEIYANKYNEVVNENSRQAKVM